jgi:hypothetical protein
MALIDTFRDSTTIVELPGNEDHFSDIKQRNSIDTFLRTTQQHQVQLSIMADHKANILIGTTLVLQTIIISVASVGELPIELIILSSFSLISTCLAILAVYPALSKIHVNKKDKNLLFFGHFAEMEINEFYEKMSLVLKDDKLVYKSIIKDIYQLGVYLKNRKYKYLRYSYLTFLIGLILCFVIFIASQVWKYYL